MRAGKGGPKPSRGLFVTVHCTGYLMPGMKQFWSTRKDGERVKYSTPFKFQLGKRRVIEGWDIGVASMQLGEQARFTISGNYGYGIGGNLAYQIGPYATLVYDIELIKIEASPPPSLAQPLSAPQ